MKPNHCTFAWILYLTSACLFCHGVLRRKCQVLEKKYFAQFMDLKFNKCGQFEDLTSGIAVNCDMVNNLYMTLKEVPLETDWLCLTKYLGVTMQAKSFSQFSFLKALYITGNFELLPGSFLGLSQLSILWIESEKYLGNITFHEGTFDGLVGLQELKISNVKFSFLDSFMFNRLSQLHHLTLELNNITSLSSVTKLIWKMNRLQKLSIINNEIQALRTSDCLFSEYPLHDEKLVDFNITTLDLSLNRLRTIEPNSLCNFPHLHLFKADKSDIDTKGILNSGIKTCKVIQLSNIFFRSLDICKYAFYFNANQLLLMYNDLDHIQTSDDFCENLKILDISNNYLKAIDYMDMKNLSHLTELKVDQNYIYSFHICPNEDIDFMELVYLNLSFNYLTSLQRGQFKCLKKLEILSLENNRICLIENFAFEGLNNLKVLQLQSNNLLSISEFTFCNLLFLTHLDLYENNIVHFHQNSFYYLNQLQEIKLAFENIMDIFFLFQYIPTSIRQITVKNDKIILLAEYLNEMRYLEFLELDAHWIAIDTCEEFIFSRLKELRLNNNMFFTCFGTLEQAIENFTNLEKLSYAAYSPRSPDVVTLNSSLKQLKHLKYMYLENTYQLMESGQINVYELFQGLSKIKLLHLKNSGMAHLDSKAIFSDLQDMEFLIIESQNIEDLTDTVFRSLPNLKYISFLKTTFPCSCKFNGLLSWLESDTPISIIKLYDQTCYFSQDNEDDEDINLILFLHNKCETDLHLIMFVVTFMFTLLFICISLFYESIWWYILYMVFTLKCWLNHRQHVRDCYEYDAFVSYNTHNELWVTEQLLHNMEENGPPFFKLCIHSRDFEIGRDIVENIMDSIYNSRWTVCIISRSYLQSNWCSLEMRMATYRLLTESKNSLILIFLGKISREELQHYHRLTKLLDKKTYLEWPENEIGQQLFWARLRKVIAGSGRQ